MSENIPRSNQHTALLLAGVALATGAVLNGEPVSKAPQTPDVLAASNESLTHVSAAEANDPGMPNKTTLTQQHHHAEVKPTDILSQTQPKSTNTIIYKHSTSTPIVHETTEKPHKKHVPKLPHPIIPPKHQTTPKPPVNPELAAHPENLTIPEDVATLMASETVYIPASGCSGFLIRDTTNQPIGFLTAEHCNLRSNTTNRTLGSDGNYYIVESTPVEVDTGDNAKTAVPVGAAASFILPAIGDTHYDVALGVFSTSTPEAVLSAYQSNVLSDQERQALKAGDTMYMSGWPQYQPNNAGAIERQSFPMTILGNGNVATTLGEQFPVTWAAVSASADGSECSFGASGSEGFIMDNGSPRAIGTLSAFYDLTSKIYGTPEGAQQARDYYSQLLHIDLSDPKITAVCGFSYQPPSPENGGMVVKVVESPADIPGFNGTLNPQELQSVDAKLFTDPTTIKTIVHGRIKLDFSSKGGPGIDSIEWIENPILFYDPKSNNVNIGFEDSSSALPGNISFMSFSGLDSLSLFADQSDNPLTITQTTGTFDVIPSTDTSANGFFSDPTIGEFGHITSTVEPDTTSYILTYNPDGTFSAHGPMK